MIFDFDPRSKRDGLQAESYPARLLKDILTGLITRSMSTGTASNYITQSYGSNHRILYEGVASLLADILVSSTDNIEDAKKAMRTGLNNADKAEQEALAHLESELAGREAILSFSKNEISNAVSTFKKEYETKVKLQNKLYKEKLSEELAKISNQLTTELSNLTQ
jgi:hypothetical protein